jgi:hypothetical protein
MTDTLDTGSNRRIPTTLAVGLAISAALVLGSLAAAAGTVHETESFTETHSSASFGTAVPPAVVVEPAPMVIAAPPPVLVAPPPVVVEAPPVVVEAPPVVVSRPGFGIDLPGVSIGIGR